MLWRSPAYWRQTEMPKLQSVRLMASSSANDTRSWPTSRFGAWETREFESALDSARAELGQEMFSRAWAEGQAMGLEEAVEYGLSISLDTM